MHWMGDMDTFKLYAGLAVKLESDGHKVRRWFSPPGFRQESPRLEKDWEDFGGSWVVWEVEMFKQIFSHFWTLKIQKTVDIP